MIKSLLRAIVDNTVIKLARYIQTKLKGSSSAYKLDLHAVLWEKAILDSAEYVEPYLSEVMVFKQMSQTWDYAIQKLADREKAVCLEFGVWRGTSINYFSKYLPHLSFYGFDSFEGLAEDWSGHHAIKGAFNLGGKLPKVNSNVNLIKGWFDKTVPEFISSQAPDVNLVFVHMDGDTYEAAVIVLNELKNHIKPGMLILFDEYIGYPNWRNGEYLAWKEFCSDNNIQYRYKAFCTEQALVEVV